MFYLVEEFMKPGFQGTKRPSSISAVNIFSLYLILNENKKSANFIKKKNFVDSVGG